MAMFSNEIIQIERLRQKWNHFRREVSGEQNINTQHLDFDNANFNLDEIHQESCFMIEEETNKTKDRKSHRYLKLSPCKKVFC